MQDDWKSHLTRNYRGFDATNTNVTAVLRYDPSWEDVVAFDVFGQRVVKLKACPWNEEDRPEKNEPGPWTDSDTARLCGYLARNLRIIVSETIARSGLQVAAESNLIHPVQEYLKTLVWDGKQRLDGVVGTYFGGADTEYTRGVGPKWFIGAVARIYEPGCQMDNVLILESDRQGQRKTTVFRTLVPNSRWFCETPISPGDKDSYQNLHNTWLYCLDELDSLSRGEATKVKNYITATMDHYRKSYGREVTDHPRSNVFAGTTNEKRYLNDPTGNRRYWPIAMVREADYASIERDRDQLWAEAVTRYKAKERWHVWEPNLLVLCEAEQLARMEENPLHEGIARWYDRTEKGLGESFKGVTCVEALQGAFGMSVTDMKKVDLTRAGQALRAIGCERSRTGTHIREYRYKRIQPFSASDGN